MPLFDPTADAISRRPLPQAYIKSPNAIAKWIDDTVPCVVTPQSMEVTLMVIRHLRSRGVGDVNIAASLAKSAYQFTFSPLSADIIGLPSLGMTANPSSGPSMRAAPPMTLDEAKRSAQMLDADYERARLNHDVKRMQTAANNLDSLIRAFERMLSDKRRLEEVREEILRNSRNIAPIIRRAERARPVPGPDGRTARRVGLDTYVLEDLEESESEREEAE